MERHDIVQPLLTDYVLGDITAADRQRVEAHLSECAACAAEFRDLALAFQSIGLEVEPVAPPPYLRARVLEQLSRPASAQRTTTRAQRRTSHPAWIAVAAAAVVALGTLLTLSALRTSRVTEDLRQATADARRLAQQMAATEAQADLVVGILTASDMRRIDLAGLDASRDATARAYWSAARGLLIVADRLPQPPRGRVYQVWLIGEGSGAKPVSAGLIEAPRGGRGMLIVPAVPGVQGRAVTVAVTDEPPGGLPAPTGAKHLIGS